MLHFRLPVHFDTEMFDTLSLLKLDGLVNAQEKSTSFSMRHFLLACRTTQVCLKHVSNFGSSRYVATKRLGRKPAFTIFVRTFGDFMTLLGSCSESLYNIRRYNSSFTVHCALDGSVLYEVSTKVGFTNKAVVLRCEGGIKSSWLKLKQNGRTWRILKGNVCIANIGKGSHSVWHAVVSKRYDFSLLCLIVLAVQDILDDETALWHYPISKMKTQIIFLLLGVLKQLRVRLYTFFFWTLIVKNRKHFPAQKYPC